MKITDGLFLNVGERVSKDYPDIKFNNMIIDNWWVILDIKCEQYLRVCTNTHYDFKPNM